MHEIEHPAIKAWHQLQPQRMAPQQIETLGKEKKECVPPFTRGAIGHEIGLVLARELRPLVPGHPLPLSSPQRIQWHVCGGRRGQDGCDRADAV